MAQLAPVFLALILNLSGYYVFRIPKASGSDKSSSDAPLMSSVLFAIGVIVLILDTRLYPCTFRSLHWTIDYVYQYLLATFILEITLNDFWFPFENLGMQALPAFGDALVSLAKAIGSGEDLMKRFSDFVHQAEVIFAWSYFLSSMFLTCVLHATRIIDVRILTRCGPYAFIQDLWSNVILIKKNILCQICGDSTFPTDGTRYPRNNNSNNPNNKPQRKKINRNDSDPHACCECYY